MSSLPSRYLTWTDVVPTATFTASAASFVLLKSPMVPLVLFTAAVGARLLFSTLFTARVVLGKQGAHSASRFHVGYREHTLVVPSADGSSNRVSVSIFYPTTATPSLPVPWLPNHNDVSFTHGIAKYAGQKPWLFGHWLTNTMDVARDAPLAADSGREGPLDVVIVSHGLSGHRNISTTLCQRLAAGVSGSTSSAEGGMRNGAIVIAIGHEDGSASYAENAQLLYTPPPPGDDNFNRRNEQLLHRVKEVKSVIDFVQQAGAKGCLADVLGAPASSLKTDTLTFVGHSFGAATGLHVVSAFPQCFSSAVLFDAWMCPIFADRFEQYKEGIAANAASFPQVTLVETEQWVRWKDNRVKEESLLAIEGCAAPAPSSLLLGGATVRRVDTLGTDHMSPTDMAFLLTYLGRRRMQYKASWRADGLKVIEEWAQLVRTHNK